jgi:dihydropteroate synthase
MTTDFIYQFGSLEYNFSSRTHIVGILNVTPDSFSDGGRYLDHDRAITHGLRLAEDGADFIDVGGESTRPGSEPVSAREEIRRIVPVIEELTKKIEIPISVDTYKSAVASAALDAGAVIVNDISGMTFDFNMSTVVLHHFATVVLMHIKGQPRTMQKNPTYDNVTAEVKQFLAERAQEARNAGIKQIIIDPGIGFGKKFEHNIQLIRELRSFAGLGYPLLVGPSRKSFLGTILDLPPEDRVEGTAAAVAASIFNGANIVRVHDVKEMKRIALVSDVLKSTGQEKAAS